ncbi:AAA family ATPase [Gaoshiqia sp. Z1-71]|uniref:AAA family ATPase n=1 Tax=Gaoshiqia hydrogeniformans TaxID=3290090 RepID=UPI003BF7DF81
MDLTKQQLQTLLNEAALKADHEFAAPPTILEIEGVYGDQIFATLGNFSTILARPKVGKTTFTAIAVSSLLTGTKKLNFIPKLPNERQKILWIDTEQGKPECIKILRLIAKLTTGNEQEHPENLYFFSFRQFGNQQRIQLTEFAINAIKDLSFVIIDGIRDFVSSINDEREATYIADKLLKWTQERDIHILTILHQNKGDANARGHLGTELMNKAETVAKLVRDETTGTRLTIVEPEFTRHKDFEPFAYSIDEKGYISGEEAKQGYQPQNPKVHELTSQQLQEVINTTFNGSSSLPYGKLWQGLKTSLKSIDIQFGDNKCKELVSYMQNNHYLNYNDQFKHYSSNVPKV